MRYLQHEHEHKFKIVGLDGAILFYFFSAFPHGTGSMAGMRLGLPKRAMVVFG
jgi:hypothetical protein